MTEEDWLTATKPLPMWDVLDRLGSERKLRLFTVACCRSAWCLLTDPRSREVVEVADRYAGGEAADAELLAAAVAAAQQDATALTPSYRARSAALLTAFSPLTHHVYTQPPGGRYEPECFSARTGFAYLVSVNVAYAVAEAEHHPSGASFTPAWEAAFAWQAALVCDIFGNPFRPVALDPRWRSETAIALAAGIYADRAFDRMPILADALEEAGCDHADILAHCRGPGPHVRGCWVVDLVLGKS